MADSLKETVMVRNRHLSNSVGIKKSCFYSQNPAKMSGNSIPMTKDFSKQSTAMTKMKRSLAGSLLSIGAILLVGCPENPSVVKYQAPKAAKAEVPAPMTMQPNSDLPPAKTDSAGIKWTVPEGWGDGRASSMRMASFAIENSDGSVGDVSLVQLAGPAGGLLANVNRWRGQVGLGDLSDEELMQELSERTTQSGTSYLMVEMVNEVSGSAIAAGIYEAGSTTLFSKLSTNQAGLEEARASFYEFCDSLDFGDQ